MQGVVNEVITVITLRFGGVSPLFRVLRIEFDEARYHFGGQGRKLLSCQHV